MQLQADEKTIKMSQWFWHPQGELNPHWACMQNEVHAGFFELCGVY